MTPRLLPDSVFRRHPAPRTAGKALLVASSLLLANLSAGNGAQLQAAPSGATAATITLKAKDKEVTYLLREIERQSSYVFIYSDNRLDKRRRQTVSLANVPLETALDQVLRPLGMEYRIVGQQIILTPRRTDSSGAAPLTPANGSLVALSGPPAPVVSRLTAARTVSGTVTARDGSGPLPGVNVVAKGTTVGTATNAEGFFTLEVPEGATTLVFSYIGFAAQEVEIGSQTTLAVALAADTKTLSEVVVTGFGLERQRKSLGYSVQDVKAAEIVVAREPNIINSLSGKLAGVQINRNGSGPAGSTNIIIRGYTSLTRDSRPLVVVDGVPIDNTNLQQASRLGGFDSGDGLSTINPEDIESISVLKGGNAAALYGNRAANGVLIVTTKKGRKNQGLGVSLNSNTTFDRVQVLTDYQNEYGQGTQGRFLSNTAGQPILTADGFPQLQQAGENIGSWGARMDGQQVRHWTGEIKPYSPQPNNIEDFFETGYTTSNTVALTGGTEKSTLRVSLSDLRNKGTYPNSRLVRDNVTLRGTTSLGDKLSVDTKLNYTFQRTFNRPTLGASPDNVMTQFLYMPRSVYIDDLRDYRDPVTLQPRLWNLNTQLAAGVLASGTQRQNPFWAAYLNTNEVSQDRVNGSVAIRYDILPWLWLQVRGGTDFYTSRSGYRYASWTSWNTTAVPDRGGLSESTFRVKETNMDFILSGTRNLSEDFELTAQAFGNLLQRRNEQAGASTQGLNVPNLFTIDNGAARVPIYNFSRSEVQSLFGRAQLNFRNAVFLEATGRNDWDSTLPRGNWSYFYPSTSLAVAYTDLLKLDSKVLSLGKLRASWARVGKGASPYELTTLYDLGSGIANGPGVGSSHLGQAFANLQDQLPAVNLKPQTTRSIEFGSEMRFFKDRAGLDLTVYRTNTFNQVTSIGVTAASGFRSQLINAGNIQNQGLEIVGLVTPVKLENGFRWDLTANWAKNQSKVVALNEGGVSYFLGNESNNVSVVAAVGKPFGDIFGTVLQRAPDGQLIVDANGFPLASTSNNNKLGNFQPDWFGGLSNTFSYKGLSLSVLLDARWGGQIYSVSQQVASVRGNARQTLDGRQGWYESETARLAAGATPANWTPTGGVYVEGVVKNADGSFTPKAGFVNPESYWARLGTVSEPFVYDATFIKLREVALGYRLPSALLSKAKFIRGASFSIVGRNLAFLRRDTEGFDPESGYNLSRAQGLESGGYPNSRSLGYNLNLEF
ncbi:SusC/RagA family TonB-linked outer membrane protein [Hymenobacter psychrotolerans]|uniref:TonB-linked outer membrane protein, SusC/RagA family n=1 Tax=Hymenobacter psychrotolerans DSM 18569 TaxID=1121959 RepID=A0A1M7EQE8_9BACT|nr:SusC/RagA family TonB-linked outer membrane protein [Hymenobacter psychrotolerans]SHL93910.1 TonB-linked outer membrane protein, SusC/RagA family [Hymenobacter psychrotolerans DSM 18569]